MYPQDAAYFNNTSSYYVWDGNPEYEEYFVTSSNTGVKKILKVALGETYDSSELEVLISGMPEAIGNITYLPRSKRYYLFIWRFCAVKYRKR